MTVIEKSLNKLKVSNFYIKYAVLYVSDINFISYSCLGSGNFYIQQT